MAMPLVADLHVHSKYWRAAPLNAEALDPEQLAAVTRPAGPCVVVAGPGTGKTHVLVHRIAHSIEGGIRPAACLALTFSRRAANEMRERLLALVGPKAEAVTVTTFHGLGLLLLREFGAEAGLVTPPAVATHTERLSALQQGLSVGERAAGRWLDVIAYTKRTEATPEPGSDLAQTLTTYNRCLRAQGLFDVEDLLLESVHLLERNEEVRRVLVARHALLAVDEYQDIDALQYRLVRLLAPADGNIFAIGDPDQSIYGFRGADAGLFLRFQQDFPGASVVHLTRNYRSIPAIVDAAAQVVAKDSLVANRRLSAVQNDARRITVHRAATDRSEAEFVVQSIEGLVGGGSFFAVDSGRVTSGAAREVGFGDIAVLYRTAAQLPCLTEALARAGIPYQRYGETSLAEHPDVVRLLNALEEQPPTLALPRALQAAARTLLSQSGEMDAIVARLLPMAERAGNDRTILRTTVALTNEIDLWDRADRVALLSLHASKGLEFEAAFIVGCEDGILPHAFSDTARADPAEERRLFFVGMTRAKRRLFLSYATERLWRGQRRMMAESPFLREIAEKLIERSRSTARVRRTEDDTQMSLFGG